jgi:hypothetical protein
LVIFHDHNCDLTEIRDRRHTSGKKRVAAIEGSTAGGGAAVKFGDNALRRSRSHSSSGIQKTSASPDSPLLGWYACACDRVQSAPAMKKGKSGEAHSGPSVGAPRPDLPRSIETTFIHSLPENLICLKARKRPVLIWPPTLV